MKRFAALALATLATAQQWAIERNRMATILFGVSFLDEDNGIVTGGANGRGSAVFLTNNGGATYTIMPNDQHPPPGVSMFLSGHLGSRTSAAAAGLCSWCFDTAGIQYSTDGRRLGMADVPAQGFPPVAAAQGGSMVRGSRTPHYGFVGIWGILDMDTGAQDVGIRHSTDAGVTWQRVDLTYSESGCRYMSMPSSTTWYVTCGTWPRGTSDRKNREAGITRLSEKITLLTQNGTLAWEGAEDLSEGPLSHSGYSTAVLKTVNAGASWTPVYENIGGDFYLNNLDCLDANTCYTVGEGERVVLMRTSDGGRTWTELNLGFTDPGASVMDVKFVNAREGFVAGGILTREIFRGAMFHTVNGGATWTRQTVNNIYPVSLSLYTRRDGRTGGHGVGLTPEGEASTIKYA